MVHTGVLNFASPGGACEFIDPVKDLPVLSPTRQHAVAEKRLQSSLAPKRPSAWNHVLNPIRQRVMKRALAKTAASDKPRSVDEVMADIEALDADDHSTKLAEQIVGVKEAIAKVEVKLNEQELSILKLQSAQRSKTRALRVYQDREKELYGHITNKELEIDAVDDNLEDHARVLRRREDAMDMREADVDSKEVRLRQKIAEKQEQWDKQMGNMERTAERNRAKLEELEQKVADAGLHGDDIEAKLEEDIEKQLKKERADVVAAEKDLDAAEHQKDSIFEGFEGTPMGHLLKKETQVHRRGHKLRLVHHHLPDVTHHQHVFTRELAEYDDTVDAGEISGTDDEVEDPAEEVLLPEGWSLERVIFVKMIKGDKDIQKQLSEMTRWWGKGKKKWAQLVEYIEAEWSWDASQLHVLDVEVEATKKRKDDGNLKGMILLNDFLELFHNAVVASGRDPGKWKAFANLPVKDPPGY